MVLNTITDFKLNYAQDQAINAFNQYKENKGVIVLPTGAGKTILSATISQQFTGNILFIGHRIEIIEQAESAFRNIYRLSGKPFESSLQINGKSKLSRFTFASVQTLYSKLGTISPDFFDLIIIDEAHHYQAHSFKKVVNYFRPQFLLGITATPKRHDNQDIFELCGDCIYEFSIKEAIDRDILCSVNYYCVDNDIDYSKVEWKGERYSEKDLNRVICIPEYDKRIFEEYQKNCVGKKSIAFCVTVKHADRLAQYFIDRGIKGVSLSSYTKPDDRAQIVSDFKLGKYDIIFVRDLFNEGVDIPNAECVLFLRPTESQAIFTQQLGRGLRKYPGKKELLVLDFTGNARKSEFGIHTMEKISGAELISMIKQLPSDQHELILANYSAKIRLSKSKIDFIKKLGGNTRESLIKEYHEIKSRKGTIPIINDFSISDTVINRLFGSYQKMVNEIEKTTTSIRSIRRLETEKYLRDKWEEYKLSPSFECNFRSFLSYLGIFSWPTKSMSFSRMVKESGDRNYHGGRNLLSNDEIKQKYFLLKGKLGKVPTVKDFRAGLRLSEETIRYRFGSWRKFLEEVGDYSNSRFSRQPSRERVRYDKEKLVQLFDEALVKFGRVPTMQELNQEYGITYHPFSRLYGTYNRFLLSRNLSPVMPSKSISKEIFDIQRSDVRKLFYDLKEKINRTPSTHDFTKIGLKSFHHLVNKSYGSYENFLAEVGESRVMNWSNLVCFPDYDKEKMSTIPLVRDTSKDKVEYKPSGEPVHDFGAQKDIVREKILSRIKKNDVVLLLECPKLLAVKEIIRLGIKPKKVIIPNNQEYKELVLALLGLQLPFKVEVHNCSSTKLLQTTIARFDFIWLDYYGTFTQYKKDIDLLYSLPVLSDHCLIFSTYKIFDLEKQNETHYFSEAINYYLNWSYRTNRTMQVLSDVSLRYKSTMYNVGLNISKNTVGSE